MIRAVITWKNSTKNTLQFSNFHEAVDWMELHFGEYKAIDAQQIAVSELRQGKAAS